MKKKRDGKVQSVEILLKRAMPARYAAVEKLEKAALEWENVVGPALCKQSAPLDVENGALIVAAENPLAGNRLSMMGGNIARTLTERWGLEVTKIKVVIRPLPLKSRGGWQSAPSPQSAPQATVSRAGAVRVSEEDVKEFSSRCLQTQPDLPQESAESLARLRAFFIKRFKRLP